LVLASRSEVKRGEWKQFEGANFKIRPIGSVSYKLALVSAGLADITFTLVPKNEWDVAAGVALVQSAGGFVTKLDNSPLRCNNRNPLLKGLIACGPHMAEELLRAVPPIKQQRIVSDPSKKIGKAPSLTSNWGTLKEAAATGRKLKYCTKGRSR
jgi:3'-phosphoadenosine 5'-phosphosulfate (PAPS) 3'-phosphatase